MNKYKMAWDMFILGLAIVTSFACGFEFVLLSLDQRAWYIIVSIVIDVLFFLDILV